MRCSGRLLRDVEITRMPYHSLTLVPGWVRAIVKRRPGSEGWLAVIALRQQAILAARSGRLLCHIQLSRPGQRLYRPTTGGAPPTAPAGEQMEVRTRNLP